MTENPEVAGQGQDDAPEREDPHHRDRMMEAAEIVRRRAWRGVQLWGAASLVLWLTGLLPLLQAVGVAAFFLLFPAIGIAQLPLLGVERLERIPVYVGSIITILSLGAIGLFLGTRVVSAGEFGLAPLALADFVVWTLGLTGAAFVVILVFRPIELRVEGSHARILRELLPESGREKGVFAGLSLSAGIGEELAYRGYALQAMLWLGAGPWGAALLSALPFGALHAYQGAIGVLRTAILGVILAVPVIITGSLFPSMAAHALIDLLVGLVFGPRLISERAIARSPSDYDPLTTPSNDPESA
jgi:membrane protease YdiL (CAAX protease family)